MTIESLGNTGEGVARVEGRKVLVPGTLPGEHVRVRLSRKSHVAERVAVEAPSPARVEAPCPIVDRCGGCAWQHASAEVQRDARLERLRLALPPFARAVPVEYVPAPEPYAYRTRARLAFQTDARGGVLLGFRARATHDLVDVATCAVLAPALDAALSPLRELLALLAPAGGEVSLALGAEGAPVATVRVDALPSAAGFTLVERLVDRGFAGAALYAPGATAPATAGDPRPAVRGGDGQPLWLAPEGFAQANEALNAQLAERVAQAARVRGGTVLELFAGAGNFTVLLARDARKVVAVEADAAASAALAADAGARGLANVSPVHQDAAAAVQARRADVVVLDPPRTGAREVCEALARSPVRRIVYVSCDPPTLGRDLGLLATAFELEALTAFEMFPQTPHVEVLAVLHRRR